MLFCGLIGKPGHSQWDVPQKDLIELSILMGGDLIPIFEFFRLNHLGLWGCRPLLLEKIRSYFCEKNPGFIFTDISTDLYFLPK